MHAWVWVFSLIVHMGPRAYSTQELVWPCKEGIARLLKITFYIFAHVLRELIENSICTQLFELAYSDQFLGITHYMGQTDKSGYSTCCDNISVKYLYYMCVV